jgi:hypothetical protein
MSAALRTTQGANNLRPAAALVAVFVAAAFLGGLVGFAVSRTATSEQATTRQSHPIVVRNPSVGGATGLGQATGIEHANGGTAAIPGTRSVVTGIPYVGTGPTADKIRSSSVPTVGSTASTGIPYPGTGLAAQKIRGTYVVAIDATNLEIVRSEKAAGIPYVGTGPTADKIRAASVAGAKALTGLSNATGIEHANGGNRVTAGDVAAGTAAGDMTSAELKALYGSDGGGDMTSAANRALYGTITSVSAKAGNGEDMGSSQSTGDLNNPAYRAMHPIADPIVIRYWHAGR